MLPINYLKNVQFIGCEKDLSEFVVLCETKNVKHSGVKYTLSPPKIRLVSTYNDSDEYIGFQINKEDVWKISIQDIYVI